MYNQNHSRDELGELKLDAIRVLLCFAEKDDRVAELLNQSLLPHLQVDDILHFADLVIEGAKQAIVRSRASDPLESPALRP
jgi:hypothetical protein